MLNLIFIYSASTLEATRVTKYKIKKISFDIYLMVIYICITYNSEVSCTNNVPWRKPLSWYYYFNNKFFYCVLNYERPLGIVVKMFFCQRLAFLLAFLFTLRATDVFLAESSDLEYLFLLFSDERIIIRIFSTEQNIPAFFISTVNATMEKKVVHIVIASSCGDIIVNGSIFIIFISHKYLHDFWIFLAWPSCTYGFSNNWTMADFIQLKCRSITVKNIKSLRQRHS